MDSPVMEAQKRMRQLIDAEGLGKQEAIEVGCEQVEEDGLMGDYNYLELVKKLKEIEGV